MNSRVIRILALKVSFIFIIATLIAGLVSWSASDKIESLTEELKSEVLGNITTDSCQAGLLVSKKVKNLTDDEFKKKADKVQRLAWVYASISVLAYLATTYLASYVVVIYIKNKLSHGKYENLQ